MIHTKRRNPEIELGPSHKLPNTKPLPHNYHNLVIIRNWQVLITPNNMPHIFSGLLNNCQQCVLPLISQKALDVCLPYWLYWLQCLCSIQALQLLGQSGNIEPLGSQ